MTDRYNTASPEQNVPESVCTVFQDRLYHHYPQYRGKLTNDQCHQLRELAKTITLKTDSSAMWQSIESNPLLFMYFRHQMDHIHQASGHNRFRGFFFSAVIFIMGALWSWGVNEMDPTLVHLGSLLVGFLGPVSQKGLEKFREKKMLQNKALDPALKKQTQSSPNPKREL